MMNQKINTNCKKETLLTGQICFPLRIGERAVIIGTGSRSMITSRVSRKFQYHYPYSLVF